MQRTANFALSTLMLTAATAWGGIVYSGPKNIVFQGSPTTEVKNSINLAGSTASWDRITFVFTPNGVRPYSGWVLLSDDSQVGIVAGRVDPVAMRMTAGTPFPAGARFSYMPSSGVSGAYGQGIWSIPADGEFYSAIGLGLGVTGETYYPGWIHLKVENSATTSPRLTIIDWAYSDQMNQKPSMGQTSGVPGPSAPLSCAPGNGTIPTVGRVGGLTEFLGDIILDCVGGTPTPAGQAVPKVDFTFSLKSDLTNFVTNLGSIGTPKFTSNPTNGLFSEALLLVDEPSSGPGSFFRPLLNCGQAGAPDNGPSGPGVCSIISTGVPTQTYDGVPNGYGPAGTCSGTGSPAANTYGCGRPNVFQGKLSALAGQNTTLRFSSVPIDPPGDAHRLVRLSNVRVNVADLYVVDAWELPIVMLDVAIQAGTAPVPVEGSPIRAANLAFGLLDAGVEKSVTTTILAREGFPSSFAFRNISAGAGDNNGVPGNGRPDNVLRYNGGGSSYPADVAQNVLGTRYFSESGYLWQNNGVNRPPAVNPPAGIGIFPIPTGGSPLGSVGYGGTNTGIDKSGLAQAGTRVAIKFTNIPAGARVEVPPTVRLVQSGTTLVSGVAALTTTDSTGAGPYSPRSGFFTPQDNVAVYEMLFADGLVKEDLNVPFTLTGAPAGTQLKAIVMLAPFYSNVEAGDPSAALPEPRFADPTKYVPCLTVACMQVSPTQGPNTAPVNVTIAATPSVKGFPVLQGAQVKLTAAGQPDILGTGTTNTPDSWTLKTTFNLTGANAGARDIVITAADGKVFSAGTFTITGTTCTFNVNPLNANYPSAGGSGQINVTGGASGCSWTATTSSSWISLKNKTATAQSYSVAANMTNSERSGTIQVGGKTFAVTQEPACLYTLDDYSGRFTATGGTKTVKVAAPNGCKWTAVTTIPWASVIGTSSGSGSGRVQVRVEPNWGYSRNGNVTIAGKSYNASQPCAAWLGCF